MATRSMLRSRLFARAFALLCLLGVASVVQPAETKYPTRPVRLVSPFPPGGGVDALARFIAPKLTDSMGQTWVVDNRTGAAGNIGTELVARAAPDGHTVLMALNTTMTANPSLYKLTFSVEKDLQPVALLSTSEHVVIVHPSVPAKTFEEFVAVAKQKPGAYSFGSSGVGGAIHLAAELLKKRAGINLLHVAYKGGGPAAAAVVSGESQVIIGSAASTIAFINAGRLRPLATTALKRSKLLTDLPTVAEFYPGFEAIMWFGLFVPGPTPKNIVERIRVESLKAVHHPDVQTAMTRLGMDLETGSPAELAARMKNESAVWGSIIKEAGIRVE